MDANKTREQVAINYTIGYLKGLADALTCCGGTEKMVEGIRDTTEVISLSMAPKVEAKPFEQ